MATIALTQHRSAALTGGALALFLAGVHTVNDAVATMLAPLLPTIQDRFALGPGVLALLIATLSFSSAVIQPLLGALSDRLGARGVAAGGMVLSAALLSLVAVAPSVPALVFLLVVGGLGSAAFHPAATSVARAGTANPAVAVSLYSTGGMLGVALGPLVVMSLAATLGTGATPWLMIPGIAMAAVLYALAPAPAAARAARRAPLIDPRLVLGPVGGLAAAGALANLAFVTVTGAVPLWLVERGVPRDGAAIGWTLTAFSVGAALGGVGAGMLSARVDRRLLVVASMLLALAPLAALLALEPATPAFYLAAALGGALVNASSPLLLISAQDAAPDAVATASGMLMGLTTGLAGLLYAATGQLQGIVGLGPAMVLGYLALVPAAAVAWAVLGGAGGTGGRRTRDVGLVDALCACADCPCDEPAPAGLDAGVARALAGAALLGDRGARHTQMRRTQR